MLQGLGCLLPVLVFVSLRLRYASLRKYVSNAAAGEGGFFPLQYAANQGSISIVLSFVSCWLTGWLPG